MELSIRGSLWIMKHWKYENMDAQREDGDCFVFISYSVK